MSEKRLAKMHGANLVKNSGRGEMKGDAKWKEFLVDYKENSSTFTLTHKAWLKMAKDAWNDHHKEPLIYVVFDGKEKVAMIDANYLEYLVECREIVEADSDE